MFFSLHLKKITIRATRSSTPTGCPSGLLLALTSISSTLPTSSLQVPSVNVLHLGYQFLDPVVKGGSEPLESASKPRLPRFIFASGFPALHGRSSRGVRRARVASAIGTFGSTSTMRGVAPLPKAKELLKFLHVQDPPGFTIDASFIVPTRDFWNLALLDMDNYCGGGNNRWAFKLNNDNVTDLAAVLLQTESLLLGHACSRDIRVIGVACLPSISVHCVKLKYLEINFNTTHSVGYLMNAPKNPWFEQILLNS